MVTGSVNLAGDASLVGFDVRPADGKLYGVTPDGAIVTVDAKTGMVGRTEGVGDGAGPLVHRRYSVVVDSALSQREVFDVMSHNLAEFAPSALANFTKAIGRDASLEVGDEFDISMLGPWNGRVRVTTKTDSSFTLVTLVGHPEAGHIVFGVEPAHEPHLVAVTIESWARARDALVELTYAKLGVGKQMQTEVWVTFLHRLSATIGVTETPDVDVSTELQSHEPADEPLNEPAHGH